MPQLFLVQHGQAQTKDVDPERGLTERGAAEVEKTSTWAARAGVKVCEIRHSGKPRAEQTANILGRHLGPDHGVVEATRLNPKDDVEALARELDSRDTSLMVVGHLPFLDRLASRLVAGDPTARAVRFTNAGIVCLGRDAGKWSLEWAVTPQLVVQGTS